MEEYDTIPRVLMTQEEIQRLAQIQPTISDIVDRYITTWVTAALMMQAGIPINRAGRRWLE